MFTLMYNLVTRSLVVLLVAMLSVNYLPDALFKDFPLEPRQSEPLDFDSAIQKDWNSKLSDGHPEFIGLNSILGPESIVIAKSGLIYTGLADGRIVQLDPSQSYKAKTVLRAQPGNPKCKDNVATMATDCGRFLQLRLVNDTLYAVEANSGLYKIDVKAGTKTFSGPKKLHKTNIYNSFVIDNKEPNIAYLTISSSRWDLLNLMWSPIEQESTGEIIALDMTTGKRVIILDKLAFPNGIDIDVARDRLVFTETFKNKVNVISLKDVRAAFKSSADGALAQGVASITLIPLLPGSPDNIIIEADIAYIAMPFVKPNGKEPIDHLASMPNVKKAIGRFIYGAGIIAEYVCNNLFYHPLLETAYRELKCGHVIYRIIQDDKSGVLEYNLATGSSRFYGSTTFGFVSEAVPDHKGNLFLGSFRSPFIVKQKIQ